MFVRETSRSNFIHASRWIAALIVVLNHLRAIVFKDYTYLTGNKNILVKAFYMISGIGHQAVVIFFVLSGYLITKSVLSKCKENQFEMDSYMVIRMTRLYIVLLLALPLTFLFDTLGSHFDTIGLYTNKVPLAILKFDILSRLGIGHFLTSLFMLQGIVKPPYGSNGPLWSLNYEFWYYVLFPCLAIPLFTLYRTRKLNANVAYFLVVLLLACLLPSVITGYFCLWLLGLVPVFLTVKWNTRFLKFFLALALIAFVMIIKVKPLGAATSDFMLGIIYTLWLSCYSDFKQKNNFSKISEFLASFSYSLYLIHMPFCLFILTVLNHYARIGICMNITTIGVLVFVISLLCTYFFAYLIAYLTEFRTAIVNKKVMSIIRKRSS